MAKKTIRKNDLLVTVYLRFSNKLTSKHLKKVQQTVLDALVYQADTGGIVPEDVEGFTMYIAVQDPITQEVSSHNFML